MGEDDNLAGCGFFDKPVRHLFAPAMIEGCHRVIEHQLRFMLGRRQFGEERGESDAGLLTLAQDNMDLGSRVGTEDRKRTSPNSSQSCAYRMPSSAYNIQT